MMSEIWKFSLHTKGRNYEKIFDLNWKFPQKISFLGYQCFLKNGNSCVKIEVKMQKNFQLLSESSSQVMDVKFSP